MERKVIDVIMYIYLFLFVYSLKIGSCLFFLKRCYYKVFIVIDILFYFFYLNIFNDFYLM